MAELIEDWGVAYGYDCYFFGEGASEDLDLGDKNVPIAETVVVGFSIDTEADENDEQLVSLQIQDGAFADRRILLGLTELREALHLAGIT